MIAADDWKRLARLGREISADLAEFSTPQVTNTDEVVLAPSDDLLAVYDARIVDGDLREATRSRFVSTHYADAVESGVKCLNQVIRDRSGSHEDGDALMTSVFSANTPVLRINPMRSQSDISAQRGHMQLCQGVVAAWRNPRAHTLLDDDPLRAVLMLETIQELVVVTKGATRVRRRKAPRT